MLTQSLSQYRSLTASIKLEGGTGKPSEGKVSSAQGVVVAADVHELTREFMKEQLVFNCYVHKCDLWLWNSLIYRGLDAVRALAWPGVAPVRTPQVRSASFILVK